MMKNPTPTPAMSMPIPLELHQQLLVASLQSGFQKEAWEIGATAIREWLVRNQPDTFGMAIAAGYQWKNLFLPRGTLLRTVFKGTNSHAVVEGDKLVHEGVATTPSQFANMPGGVRRNAWKVIWVLFPNTSEWKRADELRPGRKPSGQRLRQGRIQLPLRRKA